jgi:glycosyltransferase involved in cell wall biosynthesis
MRIAMLSDASAVHTRRWGDALHARGHTVELLSLESGTGYAYPYHRLDSRLPARYLRYPLVTGRVRRWLARFRPDLVNAHFVPNYGLIGVLAGWRPLVVSVWGSDVLISGRRSFLHRQRARFVLRRADYVTTDADMLTRAAVVLGAHSARVLTVPMGVDLTAYPERTGADPGPVIVSTRKLEPVYNLALLVGAVPDVLAAVGDARFVIVGDGPERPALAARVQSYGAAAAAQVAFRGMIPHAEIASTLYAGTVYVSTSLSDSTSVSLLEAMAAGAFPVVTDIEANHEWIDDGVNGYLVPVDDPARLAARIVDALADPELRARARRHNRALIQRRASWQDNMDAIEALFERLARAPTGGTR